MPGVVAGFFGIGGPEVVVILLIFLGLPLLIVFLIVKAVTKNKFSRFCPKCGRGLNQPKDAACCAYCGFQLP
jgi:hypothetical protein